MIDFLTKEERVALKADLAQKADGNKQWANFVGENNLKVLTTAYEKLMKEL